MRDRLLKQIIKWWRNIEVDSLEISQDHEKFKELLKQRFPECSVSEKKFAFYIKKNKWENLSIKIKEEPEKQKSHLVIRSVWNEGGCFNFFLGFMRWLQPFYIKKFEEETKESLCRNIYRKYGAPTRFISPRQHTVKAYVSWLVLLVAGVLAIMCISKGNETHQSLANTYWFDYDNSYNDPNPVFSVPSSETVCPHWQILPDGRIIEVLDTVRTKGGYGYQGLTDASFDRAFEFVGNYGCVEKDGKSAIINRDLKVIVPYDSCRKNATKLTKDLVGISIYDNNEFKYGVIDANGKWILPIGDYVVEQLKLRNLIVFKDGKHYYTDLNGNQVSCFSNVNVFEHKTGFFRYLSWALALVPLIVLLWLTKWFFNLSPKQHAINLLCTAVAPTCIFDHDKHEYPNPMFNTPDSSESDATLVSTETVQ